MKAIDVDVFESVLDYADSDVCEESPDGYCSFGFSREKIKELLRDIPTVDAVPVVRCKDCVNGTGFVNKQGAEYVDCVLDDYSVRKPTDYCSYGKLKEGAYNEP